MSRTYRKYAEVKINDKATPILAFVGPDRLPSPLVAGMSKADKKNARRMSRHSLFRPALEGWMRKELRRRTRHENNRNLREIGCSNYEYIETIATDKF